MLETWSPPSAVSNDVSGVPGDASEGDPGGAPQNGRVDRQMVWGGCVGLVLKGRVKMEPLIAQVPPSSLHISIGDYRMTGQIYSSILEFPGTTCMTVVLMNLAALHMQCIWIAQGSLSQACGRASCASEENCLALSVFVIKEMKMLQIINLEVTHFPVNMSRTI